MKHIEEQNEEFRKYREQMHGDQTESRPAIGGPNKTMRAIFGLIMVIVYIGVGVLLLVNFFGWEASWTWVRWVVGIILIIYGAFRAVRYFKGID